MSQLTNVLLPPTGAANDTELTEFPDAVQRAISAYCVVYKAPRPDVAAVARLLMCQLSTAADNLGPFSWFQLIRDRHPHLRALDGGVQ